MSVLDFLFPKKCAGCGKKGTYFCANCIRNSKLFFPRAAGIASLGLRSHFGEGGGDARQICPVCERASVDGVAHVQCRKRLTPDGLTSIWSYEKAPRELVLKLKYKYVSDVALSLAVPTSGVLKNTKRSAPNAPKWNTELVLVPIPLHWTRKNWRGFNHVEEVGKILSQLMGWQMANLLVRSKMAKQQVGLKGKERKENIQGVFVINPKALDTLGAHDTLNPLVLFDDVWTTGATMKEAAKVLKTAGFKRVWCLTLAR